MWLKWRKTSQEKSKEGGEAPSFQKTWLWKFTTGRFVCRGLMYPYIYWYIALQIRTLKFCPSLCKTDVLSFIQPILFASTISQVLAFLHSVTVLTCPHDATPCVPAAPLYFSRYSVVFFKKKEKKESMAFQKLKEAIRLHSFVMWWRWDGAEDSWKKKSGIHLKQRLKMFLIHSVSVTLHNIRRSKEILNHSVYWVIKSKQ